MTNTMLGTGLLMNSPFASGIRGQMSACMPQTGHPYPATYRTLHRWATTRKPDRIYPQMEATIALS